jgi:hypothetical protein
MDPAAIGGVVRKDAATLGLAQKHPEPAVFCVHILNRHAARRADVAEGTDFQPDHRPVAQAGDIISVDAVEQRARLRDPRCTAMQVAVGQMRVAVMRGRWSGSNGWVGDGLALSPDSMSARSGAIPLSLQPARKWRCFARDCHIVPANDLITERCASRLLRSRCE